MGGTGWRNCRSRFWSHNPLRLCRDSDEFSQLLWTVRGLHLLESSNSDHIRIWCIRWYPCPDISGNAVSTAAGYMGAVGKLYNSSGVLLLETGYSYNSVYASGMTVYASTWTSHGTFYSRGWSRAWDGYSYHACQTYQSPYQTY